MRLAAFPGKRQQMVYPRLTVKLMDLQPGFV